MVAQKAGWLHLPFHIPFSMNKVRRFVPVAISGSQFLGSIAWVLFA
jgi:hypothetical protein